MAERIRRLIAPIVGKDEIAIGQKRRRMKVVNVSEILDTEAQTILTALDEKAHLARQFEQQVRGHLRRPRNKPRRTSQQGEERARAKETREGPKRETISQQIEAWLEGGIQINLLSFEPTLKEQPAPPVFIALSDLNNIRETIRLDGLSRLEPVTQEEDEKFDPEIKAVLDDDQIRFGEHAQSSQEPDNLTPRLRGPAIHWVEKPDISELI